jgi:hypothetical protein
MFYDEFTQPPIGQAPKIPPMVKKPAGPAAATLESAKAAAPPPPPPPAAPKQAGADGDKSVAAKVADTAAKVTLPIRSIAEEAAQKAKQVKLQSLRDKVYGKGGEKKDESAAEDAKEASAGGAPAADKEDVPEKVNKDASESSLPSIATDADSEATERPAGLQSPTTGAWRGGGDVSLDGGALRTVQSPTTTGWKPTDIDAPITSWSGSVVASASAEEIAALEKAETIEEQPDEEEDDEDDEEEEEEEKKEESKK